MYAADELAMKKNVTCDSHPEQKNRKPPLMAKPMRKWPLVVDKF